MMKNHSEFYDITIVGGSFSGLLCALKISKDCPNLKIALIEKRDLKSQKYQPDGKSFAISKKSSKIFQSIGIWHKIEELAGSIDKIVITEQGFKKNVNFSNEDNELGFVLESYFIHKFLSEEVIKNKNITLFSPDSLESVVEEGGFYQVKTNKTNIRGKLLIAADGRNSKTRDLLDISVTKKEYKQTAILFQISHTEKHDNIAYEHFTDHGPMAILPMKNDNIGSVVWILESKIANSLSILSDEQFLSLFNSNLPLKLDNTKIITDKISYDLNLVVSNSFYQGRILLLGDSMHAIHPIAGQGFNLTISDIASLSAIIKTHHNAALDIGSEMVMKKFIKDRSLNINKMIKMTDGLNNIFLNKNPLFKKARRLGLKLVENTPKLKKFFISNAGG
jgi:2-octaprenyl-6-methoxyphenol hydroxylase